MSSQSVRLFKGLLASAGIVGFGYFLLEKTVPSGADIYKELPKDVQDRVKRTRDEQVRQQLILIEQIKENALSDRPVWDVRTIPMTPPKPGSETKPSA